MILIPTLTLLLPALAPVPQGRVPLPNPKSPQPAAPTTTSASVGPCTQIGGSFCVPFDNTFTVVPFGSTTDPCGRNDDDSHQLALNGWSFDFYGTVWNDIFVNNNGNVSFGVPFGTFSASGFPTAGFPMVAPFWGDVDTRADIGTDGAVWYREWSTAAGDAVNRIVVVWDNVGYYDVHADKLNTFQLILTDGLDPAIGVGNNVCFCYDDMAWTTGDASSGVGGFGGIPATAGANQGNGVDFFQIGRFDQPGNAYDGPGGLSDGIDYLDGQRICFSVTGGSVNVPPVFVGTDPEYTVDVGSVLQFDVSAIGPETGQVVTLTDNGGSLANFSTSSTAGNPAVTTVTFAPDSSQLGTHAIIFTATDDGTPTGVTNFEITLFVSPEGIVGNDICSPNAPNSTGLPGRLWAAGNLVAAANHFSLSAADLPANAFGYLIVSPSTGVLTMPGGSQGDMCINGPTVGRYNAAPMQISSSGAGTQTIDLTQLPDPRLTSIPVLGGQTLGWQLWYRDSNPNSTSNWTNAVRVTFQ